MAYSDETVVGLFLKRASREKPRAALWSKDPLTGDYTSIDWTTWQTRVRRTALGLHHLGVRKGDRVAILSENRPEWTYADLGILSLGAVTVPVYPTLGCEEILYLIRHAEAQIVCVSTREQLRKIEEIIGQCAHVRQVIVFDPVEFLPEGCQHLDALMETGGLEALNDGCLYDRLVQEVKPQDLATLIYTSGTTGPPKGVCLTHANFVENYRGAKAYIPISETDVALSFLPLSHVFERLAGYYFMFACGASIAYAENMNTVAEDIQKVRPTVAAAVPRFYEKVHARIQERLAEAPPLRQKLFRWALETGKHYREKGQKRETPSFGLWLQFALADRLVLKKIRERLGGRIRFFISGGAPLPKYLAEFFYAAGVLILEGYGLTETSPVMTVNAENDFVFGTVGKPLPNVEVKIAADGEILTRGPCVMQGYYKRPEETAEVIRDGWFYTGDIGRLDERGFLSITDRKKDIIVTSGGKNIAPQNIENKLTAHALIQQAVLIGDGRHYIVALIVPNRAEIEQRIARADFKADSWKDMLALPEVRRWMEQAIHTQTQGLAAYECVKYFDLLEEELTQAAGELTPTLKIKRKVVMEKFRDRIDRLYAQGAAKTSSMPNPACEE